MKDVIYEKPAQADPLDHATTLADRLYGLGRLGVAVGGTDMNIDLEKSGYTEMFEVIVILANDIRFALEDIEVKMSDLRAAQAQSTK